MREQLKVTGIVLSVMSIGENDRRITILTRERGKIQVFARGSRKPNHPLFGLTQPLVLGEFMITEGRNAAYLNSGEGKEYFPLLKSDLTMIWYGSYFAELAEYFTVEGIDERDTLNLLYVTFRAMEKQKIPLALIRRIYEYRILQCYGIGLQVFSCIRCGRQEDFDTLSIEGGGVLCSDCKKKTGQGTFAAMKITPPVLYTLQYIQTVPLGSLYSFQLSDEVYAELSYIVKHFLRLHADHTFKSARMLEML